MSDLLVILGAGASHDGLRPGEEPPPLATNLFDRTYDEIQRLFTGVDGLRDTILAQTRRGHGLEAILGELAASPNENIRRQVFEIPIYLKVLLGQFTSSGRACTYDQLITLIQRRGLTVTFVTLNYDTLLDRAIERKFDTPIESMGDYVKGVSVSGWNYIKLHGSVNWGYQLWEPVTPIIPFLHSHIAAYLSEMNYQSDDVPRDSSRISLLPSEQALSDGEVLIYPALAIPTDSKNEFTCPRHQVGVLRSALQSDPAILVIGNQGLDTDLMAILREAARPRSSKPFQIIDPSNGTEVAARFSEALGRSGYSVPRNGIGFQEFVESDDAERFFDEVRAASN